MKKQTECIEDQVQQKLEQLEFILFSSFQFISEGRSGDAEIGISLAIEKLAEVRSLIECQNRNAE